MVYEHEGVVYLYVEIVIANSISHKGEYGSATPFLPHIICGGAD